MGKMVYVVMGAAFGDEGKGAAVQHVLDLYADLGCPDSKLVVRFNGGHQAGHTGVTRHSGRRHVFSTFGSGTFHSVPTYISKFCTFSPVACVTEYDALVRLKEETGEAFEIKIYVDPCALLCTHMDYIANKRRNESAFASVGVGFGDTLERCDQPDAKTFAADLLAPEWLFEQRMANVDKYYCRKSLHGQASMDEQNLFYRSVERCRELIDLGVLEIKTPDLPKKNLIIFEGAQGIQLDMDHGIFPWVTRSNTTSKNAEAIMGDWAKSYFDSFDSSQVYVTKIYVTRTYLTRHGSGPFPEDEKFEEAYGDAIRSMDKTNFDNPNQGKLRLSTFDRNVVEHSILLDSVYFPNAPCALYYTWGDIVPPSDWLEHTGKPIKS